MNKVTTEQPTNSLELHSAGFLAKINEIAREVATEKTVELGAKGLEAETNVSLQINSNEYKSTIDKYFEEFPLHKISELMNRLRDDIDMFKVEDKVGICYYIIIKTISTYELDGAHIMNKLADNAVVVEYSLNFLSALSDYTTTLINFFSYAYKYNTELTKFLISNKYISNDYNVNFLRKLHIDDEMIYSAMLSAFLKNSSSNELKKFMLILDNTPDNMEQDDIEYDTYINSSFIVNIFPTRNEYVKFQKILVNIGMNTPQLFDELTFKLDSQINKIIRGE